MRNLTISRGKRFAGCFSAVKVYIEDPEANDLTINGVSCRLLGKLRNGWEDTYPIGCEEATVFVMSGRLKKEYCREYCRIPAGTEDVFLSGSCRYDPIAGNPFLFDGITDEAILRGRQLTRRFSAVLMILSVVIGVFLGLWGATEFLRRKTPQTFQLDNMTLTLTQQFSEQTVADIDGCYAAGDTVITVCKDPLSPVLDAAGLTSEAYGKALLEKQGLAGAVSLQQQGGVLFFEEGFTKPESNRNIYRLSAVYKSDDTFWVIEFVSTGRTPHTHREEFIQWAQAVTFSIN